jgi:hypothetical protein
LLSFSHRRLQSCEADSVVVGGGTTISTDMAIFLEGRIIDVRDTKWGTMLVAKDVRHTDISGFQVGFVGGEAWMPCQAKPPL